MYIPQCNIPCDEYLASDNNGGAGEGRGGATLSHKGSIPTKDQRSPSLPALRHSPAAPAHVGGMGTGGGWNTSGYSTKPHKTIQSPDGLYKASGHYTKLQKHCRKT